MNKTVRKVLASILMLAIFAGVFACLPTTETEAASTVSRMSLIKQVVTAMEKAGATLQKGTSKEISAYKKQFSTTKTNAKYIAKAINAGIMTKTQWKSIKTKITYKDMYKMLVKADEYVYGKTVDVEAVLNESCPYDGYYQFYIAGLSVGLDNVQIWKRDWSEKTGLSSDECIELYKAYYLGYAESYLTYGDRSDVIHTESIYLNEKPSTKTVKRTVAQLVTSPEDWYTVYIPNVVDIGGTTPTRAYSKKELCGEMLSEMVKVEPKWSSSDEKILKVDKKGVMTGVKKGTATVTAEFRGRTYTQEVNVKNPETFDEYMSSVGAKKAKDVEYNIKHYPEYETVFENASYHPRAGYRAFVWGVGNRTQKSSAKEIKKNYSLSVKDVDGYIWIVNDFRIATHGQVGRRGQTRRGFSFNGQYFDSYTREYIRLDNEHETFTLKWKNKSWDKCEFYMVTDTVFTGTYDYTFIFRIPKGYDGLVMVLGDADLYDNVKDPKEYLENCELYLKIKAFNGKYDD